jgi:hypothetical protein
MSQIEIKQYRRCLSQETTVPCFLLCLFPSFPRREASGEKAWHLCWKNLARSSASKLNFYFSLSLFLKGITFLKIIPSKGLYSPFKVYSTYQLLLHE